jgi:transglutaminase-like putative cysteine protease
MSSGTTLRPGPGGNGAGPRTRDGASTEGPGAGGGQARVPARERHDDLLLANEIVLALVTLAAIVGMHRLFVDGSFRGPLALQAIVAHGVVALLRRARVGLAASALATTVAGVLFITWTRLPGTSRWLLPTGDSVRLLGDDLDAAWAVFNDVSAPAPVMNGFLLVTAAAIWVLVFVADWAAFRVSATFEALLPATALFVVAAMLGDEGSPIASAAAFAGAALLWALLHRTSNQERSSRWAGGRRASGRRALLVTGAVIVGAAVIGGAVVGPNLPGADSEPVVALQDLNDDDPTRTVLSPMVSLQTNLVEQPDVELFTVRSDRAAYWRLTSLDTFNGEEWRSSYENDEATGTLPRAVDTTDGGDEVTQEFTISDRFGMVWLPAAFEPLAVDLGDDEQRADVDQRSSTLMVDKDVQYSDGYTYDVTSRYPEWRPEPLRTASNDIPEEIRERYLTLPDGMDRVRGEALRLTAVEDTQYDKAMALLRYFKSENLFTYDQTIERGHSDQALEDFLFRTRRGYCEQFAAAFAAMARVARLPSRVVVGFTWGVQDRNDPSLFRVRGTHAHAWVEIYLGEYGWVTFDPTPGRGPPGAQEWLGIPEAQDTSRGGSSVPAGAAGDGLVEDPGGVPSGPSGDDVRNPGLGAEVGTARDPAADDGANLPDWLLDAAPKVGLAILAYVVLVPLALAAQRLGRRRRARSPTALARLWWERLNESAAASGVALADHLTIAEKADLMARAQPGSATDIQALARTMEEITYAASPPDVDLVAAGVPAWAAAVTAATRRLPWQRRLLRWLDARRLVIVRTSRLVAHTGGAVASTA